VKKLLLTFFVLFFVSGAAFAQVTTSDTTYVNIQNPMAQPPRQYEILGIEVEGLTTTSEEFVIGISGLQKGTVITIPGEDLGRAIKSIYRTGLFSNVEILDTGREAGGIYLKIIVQEQPRLDRYQIVGVGGSERDDLREKITMLRGYAVTESSIAQAVNVIQRYFKSEGYWDTEVDVEKSDPDPETNRITVKFKIDPGERLEIKDITFSGNEEFSDKQLRKALDTIKEDRWWKFFSKKLFNEEDFEKAKANLQAFYGQHGFLDFRIVGDTVYTFPYTQRRFFFVTNPARGIKVNIRVAEGPQYHVRDITWEGNTVYTDAQLTQTLGFNKGEIFNQKKFDTRLHLNQKGPDVTSLYQDIGYLFFRVDPTIEVVEGDSVDLHMQIYEDEIATIRRVSFDGNSKTHDDVVRRTLRTIPGQKYSRRAIIRTIRELGQLGYFRPQSITPNLIPNRENNTVDINYTLGESQSTDNFEFSGGFGGQGIGLILSARLNFNNFSIQRAFSGEGWNPIPSGDGQRLSLGVQVTGSGYQSYSIGFREPWLGGKPLSFGVNLSYNLISYRNSDIRNELLSSSITLGRRLDWPDDYFTHQSVLSYQLYDVAGGASFLAEGTSSVLSLTQILERNSTDNPISPTTGSLLRFSAEIAPPLPGFSQFYKLKSSYQHHTEIVGKLVMTNSIEYGYLGFLGDDQRTEFQRFRLGGTQLQQRQSFLYDTIDLRGYPGGDQAISPRRNGQAIGGRIYTKYSLELRYPAISEQSAQVYPYLFADAGNVYLNASEFTPFDLKRSVGVGVRIFLPILGLVDLSYGYRLDAVPGANVPAGKWKFLFNIGSPF
jgi:outer membrane protein insertion porin family